MSALNVISVSSYGLSVLASQIGTICVAAGQQAGTVPPHGFVHVAFCRKCAMVGFYCIRKRQIVLLGFARQFRSATILNQLLHIGASCFPLPGPATTVLRCPPAEKRRSSPADCPGHSENSLAFRMAPRQPHRRERLCSLAFYPMYPVRDSCQNTSYI